MTALLIALALLQSVELSPAQEDQAHAIMQEINCVVCSGQSIADSDAALAQDMREFIRTRVAAGDRSSEVRAALASHYGDEVLMRPPFAWHTALLWGLPLLLLVGGGAMLVSASRKKTPAG
ncbi:cytochrome c-type biogenesis protein CcmH [Hyphobacterium sp. SN044]|uniref:cytochrome c-type biogenesis protein n=1 Tax=Hyphobacterium sp. SN044 TaxID=2912575 RepID=UPI001F2BF7BA|nr:cytochrome c-type biogenesis protein [Hyphobacterium sp. SN044]MCF8879283.1 cytochrome c-type biogenesis protein CcmH [Hyphobacterium sp. SN044]